MPGGGEVEPLGFHVVEAVLSVWFGVLFDKGTQVFVDLQIAFLLSAY